MRKLASIRKIDEIRPIPDAELIECAVLGGWTVVVKRGEYKVGDLAIYCEVDGFIPTEVAPFLTKAGSEPREYNGVKGERLRTVRLRGQLSQGLLLPLASNATGFSYVYPYAAMTLLNGNIICVKEGEDVTSFLGIQKWEPPIPACLAGQVAGPWPSLVQKTDQERAQNLGSDWPVLTTYSYEVTEKLEGSSMTAGIVSGEFVVCSRNLNLRETPENSLWQQARRFKIEESMREHALDNLVVQGEIIGEGIQGNYYGIKGQDFYVFDVLNLATGKYLLPEQRRALVTKLGLKHVPVLEDTRNISGSIERLVSEADGFSHLNTQKLREGLVFKRVDGPEHFKAVSNKYLLKTGG